LKMSIFISEIYNLAGKKKILISWKLIFLDGVFLVSKSLTLP
jgi:hypothetical protein